jgi:endogenous inhibitor of DNA gyrase (YacG/DUF329 family)
MVEMRHPRILVKCLNCGKEFLKTYWQLKKYSRSYCSKKCYIEYMKSHPEKIINPKSIEALKKYKKQLQKETVKCEICGKIANRITSNQKYCSKKCYRESIKRKQRIYEKRYIERIGIEEYRRRRNEYSKRVRRERKGNCIICGKKLPLWHRKFCGRKECEEIRLKNLALNCKYNGNGIKALKRDNFLCQNCYTNKNLKIHHIDGNRKNNQLENLITLCSKCHSILTMAITSYKIISTNKKLKELFNKAVYKE